MTAFLHVQAECRTYAVEVPADGRIIEVEDEDDDDDDPDDDDPDER